MQTAIELVEEQELDVSVAMGMERALIRYFSGLSKKVQSFEEEDACSISTYYSWRHNYPDLVQAIEDRARLKALKAQRGEDVAWEARQKRRSHNIQEQAIEAMERPEVVGAMLEIVLGGYRTVDLEDYDEEGNLRAKRYNIVSYPRDQVEALKRLQELARGGALPEAKAETLEFLDRLSEEKRLLEHQQEDEEREEPEDTSTKLEDIGFGMGVGTRFTKITAETADGRTITAEVKEADIVEGESHELQDD